MILVIFFNLIGCAVSIELPPFFYFMGIFVDLTGNKYGKLTVISKSDKRIQGRTTWSCECDCGNECFVIDKFLKGRKNITCGCHLLINKTSKVCVICGIEKPKSDYHKNLCTQGGIQSKCIECMSAFKKNRYWNNRDEELSKMTKSRMKPENILQRKSYYIDNKKEYSERYKKYMSNPIKAENKKNVSRLYNSNNFEKVSAYRKEYSQRPEVKSRKRDYHNTRKSTDMQYVLKRRLRFRLRSAIKLASKGAYKYKSSLDLLGCDIIFFKKYIENKFTDGMSWDVISLIDIDHIKPCSKFDLTNIDEQKKCFYYTNLQPLWKLDNQIKSAKYLGE